VKVKLAKGKRAQVREQRVFVRLVQEIAFVAEALEASR
jgi:hypothetical protein